MVLGLSSQDLVHARPFQRLEPLSEENKSVSTGTIGC